MVNWAKLNYNLNLTNDFLGYGLDLMNSKFEPDTVAKAGFNLTANVLATETANEIRKTTGSNIGYLAKNSANGDGQAALANTLQAGWFTYQTGLFFGWPHHHRCHCHRGRGWWC